MCGRFTLTTPDSDELVATFGLDSPPPVLAPRYNIAPTQNVAAVMVHPERGDRVLEMMRWGLIPSWAKDASFGSRMINARAETAAEKPAFRAAFKRRRCLIPADGFYEWQAQATGSKVPMYIGLQDHTVFGLAGLWEFWTNPADGTPVVSCTILTTRPNALMGPIHDRMPVILPREAYDLWLDPSESDRGLLNHLLQPYPAEEMIAYPVSRDVNRPTNDNPSLIERAS